MANDAQGKFMVGGRSAESWLEVFRELRHQQFVLNAKCAARQKDLDGSCGPQVGAWQEELFSLFGECVPYSDRAVKKFLVQSFNLVFGSSVCAKTVELCEVESRSGAQRLRLVAGPSGLGLRWNVMASRVKEENDVRIFVRNASKVVDGLNRIGTPRAAAVAKDFSRFCELAVLILSSGSRDDEYAVSVELRVSDEGLPVFKKDSESVATRILLALPMRSYLSNGSRAGMISVFGESRDGSGSERILSLSASSSSREFRGTAGEWAGQLLWMSLMDKGVDLKSRAGVELDKAYGVRKRAVAALREEFKRYFVAEAV